VPYNADGTLATDRARITDALGGRTYYMGRIELEFPSGSALRSAGLRPSAYIDAGSLFNITAPKLTDVVAVCTPKVATAGLPSFTSSEPDCSVNIVNPNQVIDITKYNAAPGFKEFFLGNSGKPRLSVGIGVNWVSPFGPLRLDLAKALIKQDGDDTKLFQFNVGTQF
jgi:outer membrane protein insertion porin family